MSFRIFLAAAALTLPLAAQAESPNVTPGEWEFVSVTEVIADVDIPDQTNTERQCISQEELDSADFGFIEEEQDCELLDQTMNADGLTYSMICRADGGEATIEGENALYGRTDRGRRGYRG
ncbi:DUF3617 domain-containing protein [Vreelandella azerica]|uniref:DUF3617 domain-containing protein n=1 Tax=Vreelandella azerica TaxID=2732867 RepID=UPI002E2C4057|nr:DUF3617 family protein [Halomonas azerica]